MLVEERLKGSTCSPIILLLLSNIDSQWIRVAIQHDASVEGDRLFQLLDRLELDIAEAFELVCLLVLDETHILHRQLAEDLNHIALNDSLREIPDESQKRWLCGQRLLALIVVPKMHQNIVR